MKRIRLKLYSYHSFLFIPFIVLFLYAHNIGEANFAMTWRTLLIGLAGTAVLFGLVYLALHDRLKTGIFVTIFLFAMFQYGVFYEALEKMYYAGKWPFSNIHRYLVISYAVAIAGLFIWLKRSPRRFVRVNYFLNVLVLLLVVYNAVRISGHKTHGAVAGQSGGERDGIRFVAAARPNVYHIILDGYAANNVLKDHYGFDNSDFVKRMQGDGFRFSDSATANHYFTSYSMCGTLNMDLDCYNEKVNGRVTDNLVMRSFKENGYRVYCLPSGYVVSNRFAAADSAIAVDGPNEFEKSILRYTILRLDDLVGFFARSRLESQFVNMHAFADIRHQPRYCFMHFVAPHPPFVFDRDGNMRSRHRFAEHSWEPASAYLDQLIYVNKRIQDLCAVIVRNDPGAIILLQSDHGPWITGKNNEEVFRARAGVLFAYRAPPEVSYPQNTSLVNTYRLLFNQQFGTALQLMPDSAAGKTQLMKEAIFQKKVRNRGH